MNSGHAFDFPEPRKSRRHGPVYKNYESFRPWLRDEFMFRCVYCLKRETWGQVTSEFALDHFKPQKYNSDKKLDYKNLVYACQRCNSVKSSKKVPDPFKLLNSERLFCDELGNLKTDDHEVEKLIALLDLDSPKMIKWRWQWIEVASLANRYNEKLYGSLMDLPTDMPNLTRLNPASNSRAEGIEESWFAKQSIE